MHTTVYKFVFCLKCHDSEYAQWNLLSQSQHIARNITCRHICHCRMRLRVDQLHQHRQHQKYGTTLLRTIKTCFHFNRCIEKGVCIKCEMCAHLHYWGGQRLGWAYFFTAQTKTLILYTWLILLYVLTGLMPEEIPWQSSRDIYFHFSSLQTKLCYKLLCYKL